MADANIWHAIDKLTSMVTLLGVKQARRRPIVVNKKMRRRTDMDLLSDLHDVLDKIVTPKNWEISTLDNANQQILGHGDLESENDGSRGPFNFTITRRNGNFILSVIIHDFKVSTSYILGADVVSALNTIYSDENHVKMDNSLVRPP